MCLGQHLGGADIAGQFEAVAVAVEKVDRLEQRVVGRAEHFDAALKGANNALRFYAGQDEAVTVKGWILEGFRRFASVQGAFMARLGEP